MTVFHCLTKNISDFGHPCITLMRKMDNFCIYPTNGRWRSIMERNNSRYYEKKTNERRGLPNMKIWKFKCGKWPSLQDPRLFSKKILAFPLRYALKKIIVMMKFIQFSNTLEQHCDGFFIKFFSKTIAKRRFTESCQPKNSSGLFIFHSQKNKLE